mmetsp:Transcript_20034/g.50191  ORF Transcript_20034/g.50191 Transcript_20034/m.50191 type:complete len:181 (-) Transcript_20034:408-950(-)
MDLPLPSEPAINKLHTLPASKNSIKKSQQERAVGLSDSVLSPLRKRKLGGKSERVVPSPFSPPTSPRPGSLAASSDWAQRLAPAPAPLQHGAEAAAREELSQSVRELLLGLADKISEQAPEISPLSSELHPVSATPWQQEVAFSNSWAAAKEGALRVHQKQVLLLRGVEMLLAVKPTKTR